MSVLGVKVRAARISEFDEVLRLSIEAFADEAVLSWIIPDPSVRRSYARELFEESLRATIEAGDLVLAVTPDDEAVGVSLWHESDANQATTMSSATDVPDGTDQIARRLHAVAIATAARHPTEPHVFLSSMATLTEFRGRGAGTAMVRFGIGRAGDIGLPIYLEASTTQNRRLYLRHGFTDLGEPIALPEDGPVLQPMWRKSQT